MIHPATAKLTIELDAKAIGKRIASPGFKEEVVQ